ncbi:MAG: hypothetical protein H0U53_06335 [Actinobacteria bacterium]|nr:hypothetical protein [Actinomycetota bacterium]
MKVVRNDTGLDQPDVGDLIVVLLASTLSDLRDRLYQDGFDKASELVADLVEIVDDHVERLVP